MKHMEVVLTDGGRAAAGFIGKTGDCVTRAIAIAAELPYLQVYNDLNALEKQTARRSRKRGTARTGVNKDVIRRYLSGLGWTFTPTMSVGSGCTVHLAAGELPTGRLIVSVSRHLTAVIDGVIYDTHDPQREPWVAYGGSPVMQADGQLRNPVVKVGGGRCVYGYWRK
jgi:hypothetical protein